MERRDFIRTSCFGAGGILGLSTGTFFGNGKEFPIRDVVRYGARGNGKTEDTKAIQAAVDKTAEQGGGVVFFPAGVYLTGTIIMKSNVFLYLSPGATLLGSSDLKDYPPIKSGISSYTDIYLRYSLIYGENLVNVGIVGQGSIDGQGGKFKVKARKKPERYFDRPYIIRFVNCRHVKVEDITLTNSPMWMQHYLACENVYIHGIRVYNHCNRNNDMMDIDGCKNVVISDCIGDTDDDAITMKSSSGHLCENISISNCVISSHCNAIKLGTESIGGFRNITISNIVVKPSAHPTKIYGEKEGLGGIVLLMVDGGVLEGVNVSNVRIEGTQTPLFIRLGNRGRTVKPNLPKPSVGKLRDVVIENVSATGVSSIGCPVTGIPGYSIENLTLRNITIRFLGGVKDLADEPVPELPDHYPEGTMFGHLPAYGLFIRHVRNLVLENVSFKTEKEDYRPAVVAVDLRDAEIRGLKGDVSSKAVDFIRLTDAREIRLRRSYPYRTFTHLLTISGRESENLFVGWTKASNCEKPYRREPDVKTESIFLIEGG